MSNHLTEQTGHGPALQPQEFDLREWLHFAWRHWKLVAGVLALSLLIGAIYLSTQVPVYTATAQVLLDPRKIEPVGKSSDVVGDVPLDTATIASEIAIIRSTDLLTRVVKRNALVNDPEFGGAVSDDPGSLLRTIEATFHHELALVGLTSSDRNSSTPSGAIGRDASSDHETGALPAGGPGITPAQISATVQNLKGALRVTRAGEAYLLNISFTSTSPTKAARLANAIADAYLVDKLDARYEAAKRASAWLSDRLGRLRQQLHVSEEAVAQFRAEHNLVGTGTAATLTQDQLAQLNARLVAARADVAAKKAKVDLLDSIQKKGGSILSLPDVMNSGTISQLRQQDDVLSQQEANLLSRYNARYPSVVNIRAQRRDIQRAIGAEISRIAENIRNDYTLAKAREQAIEKTLRQVTGQNDLDANATVTLHELERTAAVNKTLFEQFLRRARITHEQSTFETHDARVITPATPPGGPSAPIKSLYMGVAGLLGIVAGGLLAYLIEALNAGFKTPREVESVLELPLLGSISRMSDRDLFVDGQKVAMPLYPALKPLSRLSESVRTVRSGVQMADVDDPPKVLQVTSTVPGEGKTTLALAMASSAAQSGAKVLVVDADLRHPSASRFFALERAAGVVDYLTGQADLADIVRYQERVGFSIVTAGSKTQNPLDLLGSDRFRKLVAQWRDQYDLVILDSPPMGPVIDPLVIANLADKVVYVVRWAATAREMVQRSIQQLAGHRKIAGIVFNMVNDAQAKKYGKYAVSYYYGGRYYKKYYSE